MGRERRALDKMAIWGQGGDPTEPVHAGVTVTQDNALRLTAVFACVRLNSETVGALPADAVRYAVGNPSVREPMPRPPGWLAQPNPETTWFELIERAQTCLEMDGNAFILITARDAMGFPSELWTLHPQRVDVKAAANGRTSFVWDGSTPLSRYGPDNPGGDVLHIKAFNNGGLRGLSPIDTARQTIGLAMAAEKTGAKLFAQGMQMPGVIEMPPMPTGQAQEAVDAMAEAWQARHGGTDQAHKPGILAGGAHWNTISVTPEQSQFLETRKFEVIEIARLFRVPPVMIGEMEVQSSWGTGVEQQFLGWYRLGLLPRIRRLETAFSQLMPRGSFIKFNVRGLLRGDSVAQSAAYASAIQNGYLSRAEIRTFEDLPPSDGLDDFLFPSNLTVVGAAPPMPTPPPAATAPGEPA
jgi:HK97 family phage portal protein